MSELGSAEWFSVEAKKRLRQIAMAGVEALTFGASVLFHVGMRYAVNRIILDEYSYFHKLLEGVIVLVFGMIYIAIAIDTLVIFIPILQGLKDLMEGKRAKPS